MDRRSWLWRRKSSPSGETESSAGSISSHFSDDQVLLNHNIQSPEVTSKTAPTDVELNETVKTLSAKLSEALENIREKENLVKQHAKVAEEAVSGWEKAESEVLIQKRLVETENQKNTILEERISHLDGALKECLRQLRQSREEQEQNVLVAVAKTCCEWEFRKSELEHKLVQLQSELQCSKAKHSNVKDLQCKLEYAEKESSILKIELVSIYEELKLVTSERDLSTHAAETASKQQLESMKKVANLEAECGMLKAFVRKRSAVNDRKSIASSSAYVEPSTHSLSSTGEQLSIVENDSYNRSGLDPNNNYQNSSGFLSSGLVSELSQYKHGKPCKRDPIASSLEINLMDDFLEMEKLAARPDSVYARSNGRGAHISEPILRTELGAATSQAAEVEKLAKMEVEKLKLEMELTELRGELKVCKDQLEEAMDNLIEVRSQLSTENEARRKLESEFKATITKLKDLTEHSQKMEAEIVELEAKLSMASEAKKKTEAEVESANTILKNLVERLEESQIDVVGLQAQLITGNEAKRAAEAEVEAINVKLKKLEHCLEETEVKCLGIQAQLEMVEGMKSGVEAELEAINAKKYVSESQLKATKLELQTLLSSFDSLQQELSEERDLHQKTAAKLEKIEIDNSVIKSASQLQKRTIFGEFTINKDKEMAIAASRFAECQKTIASINWQLKSLGMMDDFLIDSDEPLQIL